MYLYTWNYDICTWNRFWWWFYKNLAGELAKLCLALCSLNLNKIFQKYCTTFGIVLTEILQKYNICNCVCKISHNICNCVCRNIAKIFGNQIVLIVISLVRERNGGRGSFCRNSLESQCGAWGHSHTGPQYFETIW